jgi:mannose-6-phosphate isomerase-like protein (cupin superfamily)
MAQMDLESTYLSLDGQGRVRTHPIEGFWETIDSNAEVLGTLVTAFLSTEDWSNWEMHPGGDEVIVLLDGRMTMVLDEPGGERRVEMAAGATCIVPKGVWHTAKVAEPSRFMAVTYGAGTTHRPA